MYYFTNILCINMVFFYLGQSDYRAKGARWYNHLIVDFKSNLSQNQSLIINIHQHILNFIIPNTNH